MSARVIRLVPGDTIVHRTTATTKLIWLPVVGSTVAFTLTWPAIAVGWAATVLIFLVARLPLGVIPRPPRILIAMFAVSAVLATIGGDEPVWFGLGLGGLYDLIRLVAFSTMTLTLGAIVGWTTDPADLGPAVTRILRPLGFLGVPTERLGVALILTVRSIPLVADELRLVLAGWRTRPHTERRSRVDDVAEVATALVVSSHRRAAEMAATMASRGGLTTLRGQASRLGPPDLMAAALGAVVVVSALLLR